MFVLNVGRASHFQWQRIGDFYDAQARSLLDGRWDMPKSVLGIEAIPVHGKNYMYFGPFPAFLRIPIVIFTHSLDGRLTQLSMLVAFVVLVVCACKIHWRIRVLVRGAGSVGHAEWIGVALFTFVLAGGSSLVYLASQASVYEEAIIWGVALAIAAFAAMLDFILHPSVRSLIATSIFATGSILSRATVGIGPVVGLALPRARSARAARECSHAESRRGTSARYLRSAP